MKRLLTFIVTVMIVTGCSSKSTNTNKQDDTQNKATVEFKTNIIEEKHYTESKRSYAELDLKLPELSGDYKGIEKINTYYNDKYQYFYDALGMESIESMESQILESNNEADEIVIHGKSDNYWQMAHYKLIGQYGNYVSIYGLLNGGQGGVSWLAQEGDVFDLNTGNKLSLDDLFSVEKDEYMETLYQCLNKQMSDQITDAENTGERVGFHYIVEANEEERKTLILEFDKNNFYLSNDGLVIEYQKYVLGSGASGIFSFTIPYDEIKHILNEDIVGALQL